MTTPSQFESQHERMNEAADQAYDATQDFARAANGNNGHIIPAPTAYAILGNTKGMLRHITEVIDHLPSGLEAGLNEPTLDIYDQDPTTAQPRDPAAQVQLAATHLRRLRMLLHEAVNLTEAAQTALNSQGWRTPPAHEHVTSSRRPLQPPSTSAGVDGPGVTP